MKKKSIILISLICALIGMLLYAFTKGWIIIHAPWTSSTPVAEFYNNRLTTKKKVTLSFWKDEKWHHETTELVWSESKADAVYYLIANWLTLLDENNMTHKKISIQSVLTSPSGAEVYISFDRYPFNPQDSIHAKLMWIEGLLKTIRENKVNIQGIRFLIQHKAVQDPHLDFSKEWPISGFETQ